MPGVEHATSTGRPRSVIVLPQQLDTFAGGQIRCYFNHIRAGSAESHRSPCEQSFTGRTDDQVVSAGSKFLRQGEADAARSTGDDSKLFGHKILRNVFGYCVTGIRMQILFTAFPYFTQLVALFYSARNYLEGLC